MTHFKEKNARKLSFKKAVTVKIPVFYYSYYLYLYYHLEPPPPPCHIHAAQGVFKRGKIKETNLGNNKFQIYNNFVFYNTKILLIIKIFEINLIKKNVISLRT